MYYTVAAVVRQLLEETEMQKPSPEFHIVVMEYYSMRFDVENMSTKNTTNQKHAQYEIIIFNTLIFKLKPYTKEQTANKSLIYIK